VFGKELWVGRGAGGSIRLIKPIFVELNN